MVTFYHPVYYVCCECRKSYRNVILQLRCEVIPSVMWTVMESSEKIEEVGRGFCTLTLCKLMVYSKCVLLCVSFPQGFSLVSFWLIFPITFRISEPLKNMQRSQKLISYNKIDRHKVCTTLGQGQNQIVGCTSRLAIRVRRERTRLKGGSALRHQHLYLLISFSGGSPELVTIVFATSLFRS